MGRGLRVGLLGFEGEEGGPGGGCGWMVAKGGVFRCGGGRKGAKGGGGSDGSSGVGAPEREGQREGPGVVEVRS